MATSGSHLDLETAEDANTPQKSVKKNNQFINPWPTFKFPSKKDVLKWLFMERRSQVPKQEILEEFLPVLSPDLNDLASCPDKNLRALWIGHATVLVQLEGLNILTDPIFSERCSFSQSFGPKRYRPLPITIEELPRIDAVVISHSHFDHLDFHSVKKLESRFGADLHWLVPLGLKSWMESTGCQNVVELDWWDEVEVKMLKFVLTPAQHWSQRTAWDRNKTLWGSWCIIGKQQKFFFAGDTGYCKVFADIGTRLGPFSLAALPIGSFEPREFMRSQHVNPDEAVQIHCDIKSQRSFGIHWGTFNLGSSEEKLDPPKHLAEAIKRRGLDAFDFTILKHGELLTVEFKEETT